MGRSCSLGVGGAARQWRAYGIPYGGKALDMSVSSTTSTPLVQHALNELLVTDLLGIKLNLDRLRMT